MILTLNDKTEFTVDNFSTAYEILITADTAVMKTAVEKITNDNLKHATMGDIVFLDAVINGINITSPNPNTGEVNIIFSVGEKSDIDIINERLNEQDVALMELAELIAG